MTILLFDEDHSNCTPITDGNVDGAHELLKRKRYRDWYYMDKSATKICLCYDGAVYDPKNPDHANKDLFLNCEYKETTKKEIEVLVRRAYPLFCGDKSSMPHPCNLQTPFFTKAGDLKQGYVDAFIAFLRTLPTKVARRFSVDALHSLHAFFEYQRLFVYLQKFNMQSFPFVLHDNDEEREELIARLYNEIHELSQHTAGSVSKTIAEKKYFINLLENSRKRHLFQNKIGFKNEKFKAVSDELHKQGYVETEACPWQVPYFDAVVKALGPNMWRMISEEKDHKAAAARCRDPEFWENCINEVMHVMKRARKQ
tara:strand:- start:747 stop:1682 length:936 start_codon:yes stop_codon:yes gene_type:complete